MRIALVGSYERSGGAGTAMHRLGCGLAQRSGLTVQRFVEHRESSAAAVVQFTDPGRMRGVAQALASCARADRNPWWLACERRRNVRSLLNLLRRFRPDVINVHGFNRWTVPGLSRADIPLLAEIAPVAWTLHDLWPLTGDADFEASEGEVQLGRGADSPEGAGLRALGARLVWIAPSRWMADAARRIAGSEQRIVNIPYGVDTDLFRPLDRRAARELWDFNEARAVVAFVSYRLWDPRKGLATLLGAMPAAEPPHLLLVGRDEGGARTELRGRSTLLGPVCDDRLLRAVYAAADLVAVPSLADNLPNVMLEALACGVPVLGSRVGGIPDAVVEGETGWLAAPGDGTAWRDALTRALTDSATAIDDRQARCRDRALRIYSLAAQAQAYEDVFASSQAGAA